MADHVNKHLDAFFACFENHVILNFVVTVKEGAGDSRHGNRLFSVSQRLLHIGAHINCILSKKAAKTLCNKTSGSVLLMVCQLEQLLSKSSDHFRQGLTIIENDFLDRI